MKAESFYFNGLFTQAAEEKKTVDSVCYKIGGLALTGQHTEARLLFSHYQKKLTPDQLVFSRFHIGISHTRTSDYKLAKTYFLENLKQIRRSPHNGVSCFLAYQGFAFYRYFFSYHNKSQKFAQKGYEELLKLQDPPPLFLAISMDLMGHNLIQIGKVHQGLNFFKKALDLTHKNKLNDLNSEIYIAYHTYLSEFETNPDEQIKKLKNILATSLNHSDYSKSELVIQIAKLYMLKGDFQESNQFLNKNFNLIYKNQNKRKVALLNTLLAQLMIYKGQFFEAISVINAAQNFLNDEIDKSLLLPLLGLKQQATSLLGQDSSDLTAKIKLINSKMDRLINKKIQARNENNKSDHEIGEDKMGDLFDKVHQKTPDALSEIIKTGFYMLVSKLFNLKPGSKYIILCQNPETTISVDHDKIYNTGLSVTKTQSQILNLLAEAPCSKEKLIEKIWGYQYDSLRHDSLIYTNIARLRKVLGEKSKWIIADEQSYFLDSDVKLVFQNKERLDSLYKKNQTSTDTTTKNLPELNYRQLQMISTPLDSPISASEYASMWGVTKMTAVRDISDLCEKNLASKIGRGKATRYFIKTEN